MTRTGKNLLMIAVILICVGPMADTYVLIPAMAEIANALPNVNPTLISFILTMSSLMVIPTSLIAGKLVGDKKLSKKSALIIGFTLFTIGGAAGGLKINIYYILITRAILGIGNGFITAMAAAVPTDYFYGKERASVMGYYNAFGSLLAIGLTMLAGYVALINWRYVFALYLLCALIVVYHAVILEKNPPKTAEGIEEEEMERKALEAAKVSGAKQHLGKSVWLLLIITLLSQILGNTLYLTLAIFMDMEHIGNAAAAGAANGVLTVAIVVFSIIFGPIYDKLKKNTAPMFFVLLALGYLMLSHAHSFNLLLVSVSIWGMGFGLSIPYILQESTTASPKALQTFSIALINSAIFGSYVLSTFVQPLVATLFNNESMRFLFIVLSIGMLVSGVIAVIFAKLDKANKLGATINMAP